jgi:hypothetical protein
MQKKTIIILSLLSAVFSLIYIILIYYGWIRYYNIKYNIFGMPSYIENYKKLDKINIDSKRVVISLHIPDKTESSDKTLKATIKSLLDQTIRIDLITIVAPNDAQIPSDISDSISVYKTSRDYGDLNCVIPTIMREGDISTYIIVLSSGVIYGKDFIEKLVDTSNKNPDKIICMSNDNITKGTVFSTDTFDESFLDPPVSVNPSVWFNEHIRGNSKLKIKYSENYSL